MTLSKLLVEELERRKQKNPRYSLRTFARDLQVNRTTLCLVMNKRRNPSREHALKIIEKLRISPELAQAVIEKIADKIPSYEVVNLETFKFIPRWYHQGIIGLADLHNNEADPDWIAQRLQISTLEAKEGVDALQKQGLIKIVGKKMRQTHTNIATPTDTPSIDLKNYHKQNLELVRNSLDNDPIHLRDMTCIVFPIDKKDMPKIKESIKKFQRKLCKRFENKRGVEVYTLANYLFPLTRTRKSENE